MNNELKHFGVLGMKWGRRKATDGSSNDGLGSIKKYRGNDPSKKLDDTKKNLLDKGKKLNKTYKEIKGADESKALTAGKAIAMTVAAVVVANIVAKYAAEAQAKIVLSLFDNYY